ncbi:MAG: hypothetical protein Q8S02_19630, partial [Hydrogenophaga sp.]|nr:hypothetical protein [Hydrogenophaga sp.]
MKKLLCPVIIGITLIFLITLTGCVAPPAEQKITPVENYDPNQPAVTETTLPASSGFVTEVTPFEFVKTVDTKVTYSILPAVTEIPQEKSCRIYTKTQTYAHNGSAFTFNLKNPPMFINYTVIPTNITEKREVTSKTGSKTSSVITIDTYSPYSWLEITIRNKTTGEIYLQDGFGKDHSTYLKNTLKFFKRDDLLIEIKGNQITATTNIWVKPELNFDNPEQINSTV